MPIKVIKTEPVASPATALKTPVTNSTGDNAAEYSFKKIKTGAGHCNRRKSKRLHARTPPLAIFKYFQAFFASRL